MSRFFKKEELYPNEIYYPALPKSTRAVIKGLCEEVFNDNCETWGKGEAEAEELEYQPRDGFSPFSHNHGGIIVRDFSSVQMITGSGRFPAHEKAAAEIQRQYDYHLECVAEAAASKFTIELAARKLSEKDCYYREAQELEEKFPNDDFFSELRQWIENAECEGDSESTIMYEIQFMYHGETKKKHTASVSCAVNTEGPYHRRHISWAPNVFCEGAKEIEITWTTERELKSKLKKALEKCAKEIF